MRARNDIFRYNSNSYIHRIQSISIFTQPGPEVRPKLHDLPEECIREIILRITDYRDLESSSGAWTLMAALVSEQRVWRELTHFHFSAQQIEAMRIKQGAESNTNTNNSTEANKEVKERPIDWQRIYHALRRFVQFEWNHIIIWFSFASFPSDTAEI